MNLAGSDWLRMAWTQVWQVAPVSWKDWLLGGWKQQEPHEPRSLVLMLQAEKVCH